MGSDLFSTKQGWAWSEMWLNDFCGKTYVLHEGSLVI